MLYPNTKNTLLCKPNVKQTSTLIDQCRLLIIYNLVAINLIRQSSVYYFYKFTRLINPTNKWQEGVRTKTRVSSTRKATVKFERPFRPQS